MSKENMKTINVPITNELSKKLKKLAIDKEIPLPKLCSDLLEKSIKSKKFDEIEEV